MRSYAFAPKRKSKYGNKKTTVGSITFDSKMESRYHQHLLLLERAGEIRDLRLQPEYELQPSFKKDGKASRAIKYVADFEYRTKDGRLVAVDVKGAETAEFKLKRKMFDCKYPDIELQVVTDEGGVWMLLAEAQRIRRNREKTLATLTAREKR